MDHARQTLSRLLKIMVLVALLGGCATAAQRQYQTTVSDLGSEECNALKAVVDDREQYGIVAPSRDADEAACGAVAQRLRRPLRPRHRPRPTSEHWKKKYRCDGRVTRTVCRCSSTVLFPSLSFSTLVLVMSCFPQMSSSPCCGPARCNQPTSSAIARISSRMVESYPARSSKSENCKSASTQLATSLRELAAWAVMPCSGKVFYLGLVLQQ